MNTGFPIQRGGFTLLCDLDGRVKTVMSNQIVSEGFIQEGASFFAILDRESQNKGKELFAEIERNQVALGWELNLISAASKQTDPMLLVINGMLYEGDVVLMGSLSASELAAYEEELTRINHELTNTLRARIKEQVVIMQDQARKEREYLEGFSKINNELANMQREITKKNIQLRKLNDEKDSLLGIASHDLRNPLNAIMGFSEFLVEDLQNAISEEQMDLLKTIYDSSRYMLGLVNDLLDYAKIEMGHLELHREQTDLQKLVERTVSINRPLAERHGILIECHLLGASWMVDVDRIKIEQIMNNLLGNAIRYSPSGSKIKVQTEENSGWYWVRVIDEGPGIPEEEMGTLFKPFGKTSVKSARSEKGTGLGLVIVKKMAEGHGGAIAVSSKFGKGSTFSFSLPKPDRENGD